MKGRTELKKWQTAQKKAHRTEKNAMTFTKYRLRRLGWRWLDFQSRRGFARTGIIDLVAVKLDRNDPDKLKVVLYQVKGGPGNRVKRNEKARLRQAIKKVEVDYNWVEKPGKSVEFWREPTD